MKRLLGLVCLGIVAAIAGLAPGQETRPADKPIWLAVTRSGMEEPLRALAAKRRQDGYDAVISTEPIEKALAALRGKPAAILLAGDCQEGCEDKPWYVPSRTLKLYRWQKRQRLTYASDAALGDIDGDDVPEVPVGRLPVRTSEQLKAVVQKMLAYERRAPTLEDLRLTAWAGAPGYDEQTDSLATGLLISTIQQFIPPWAQPWIISGDPAHSLCGWPGDQADLFAQRLAGGGAFAFMIGHGDEKTFYSMTSQKKDIVWTDRMVSASLAHGDPVAPMLILACGCGNFAYADAPCLAETLLLAPGGPVAVIAATTDSHPLTNYFTGRCALKALGAGHRSLGTLWLATQKNARKARNLLVEPLLKDVEGSLEENINVANLRRDQMLLYALLGDPATRLRLPEPLHGKLRREGSAWTWEVERPKDASRLYVGLCAAGQSFPPAAGATQKDHARQAHEAANAIFEFKPLPAPGQEAPWKGTVNKPGRLRLVAIGRAAIYVAVLTLEAPTAAPSWPATSSAATAVGLPLPRG